MTNEPNTQIMTAAAAVMTRALLASPWVTALEFSPLRSHSSRMRERRKTS